MSVSLVETLWGYYDREKYHEQEISNLAVLGTYPLMTNAFKEGSSVSEL